MIQLGSPYTKQEIIEAFSSEYDAVYTFFKKISVDEFFAAPVNVWSPADNLVHLIKSCSPVIMALKIPKFIIRLRFGVAKDVSRSLAKVRHSYINEALASGGVATGAFIPEVKEKTATNKEKILANWQQKGLEMGRAVSKWSKNDLDKYMLPHPLLGKLTVREMLFFTLYHNMHHVNDVQRLLNYSESEWFGS